MAEDKSTGTDLLAFCAAEFQGFFAHMGAALEQFKATGRLPERSFEGASGAGKADAKAKTKRKPTAFNMFVKAKLEELKASGVQLNNDKNNNELFKLAVAEWTQLSDTQRKQYADKFKADLEDHDEGLPDQLPGTSLSVPVPPQTLDHSRAEAAVASNKRRADVPPVQSGSTVGTESADQMGATRPKKKKKKDKKAS